MRNDVLGEMEPTTRKRLFSGSRFLRTGFATKLMSVIVDLFFMSRMGVVVRTMIAGVIVVMNQDIAMVMPMFVLVAMVMPVGVRMFVSVNHVSVCVFVRMAVGVIVGMQMFVFVVALHCELLSLGVAV